MDCSLLSGPCILSRRILLQRAPALRTYPGCISLSLPPLLLLLSLLELLLTLSPSLLLPFSSSYFPLVPSQQLRLFPKPLALISPPSHHLPPSFSFLLCLHPQRNRLFLSVFPSHLCFLSLIKQKHKTITIITTIIIIIITKRAGKLL